MKTLLHLMIIAIVTAVAPIVSAQAVSLPDDRPKIGLVLSGGGARGGAHIGVLKVLEEHRVPIDVIAGTSFGAIVGGLYASGYSADELEQILAAIDWPATLSDQAPRQDRSFRRKQDDSGFLVKLKLGVQDRKIKLPTGLITPNQLRLDLRDLVSDVDAVGDFDNLPIPFRAVAADLETGRPVVIGTGNLTSAMVASMAVPALFPPVQRDGLLLVDGGVANNVPVDVARDMGADIVIVIDISAPLYEQDDIDSIGIVLDQLVNILTARTAQVQLDTLRSGDVLIQPDLGDIGSADFERTIDAIPLGAFAARERLSELSILSLPHTAWTSHMAARKPPRLARKGIDFVRIENRSSVSDAVIASRLSLKPGDALDVSVLSSDLTALYGLDIFQSVDYEVVEEDGQTGVVVTADKRDTGEDFIRFGLAIQDNFEGDSGYDLAIGFYDLAINSHGGEWRGLAQVGDETLLLTEIYQPIDPADRTFVFGRLAGERINRNILGANREAIGQVRITQTQIAAGAGMNFGNWGALAASVERTYGKIRRRIGLPGLQTFKFDETNFETEFSVDTLDDIEWPKTGSTFELVYRNGLSLFGGDSRVDSVQAGGFHFETWGANTFGLTYLAATTFNGQENETDLFPLGGFLRLSGYSQNELTGNHGGALTGIYYRQIAGGAGLLADVPIYVGGTLETGNVWNDRRDVRLDDLRWSASLFVGADTMLGPVYLGGGIGDDNNTAAFLYIGQLF